MEQKEIAQISESISMVLNAYQAYYELKVANTDVILSDNVGEVYKNKRPDLFVKKLINLNLVNSTRGITIPPKTLDGNFTVVINVDYFLNSSKKRDWEWVGTLTHEMTHVDDYFNYIKMNGLDSYDMVQMDIMHRPFVLWTEFHARAIGYFFIRKFTFGDKFDDKKDKNQIDFILQKELPYQVELLSNSIDTSNDNVDTQLYELMQFMGRYSVWEKLFPDTFNEAMREKTFGINNLLLYNFLVNHQTLEEANKDFDKMVKLIMK